MWSFGHYNLKLPRDFFKHYTLLEYFALRARYLDEQDYWPSRQEALVSNIHRPSGTDPTDHRDLMRTTQIHMPKTEPHISSATPEDIRAAVGEASFDKYGAMV